MSIACVALVLSAGGLAHAQYASEFGKLAPEALKPSDDRKAAKFDVDTYVGGHGDVSKREDILEYAQMHTEFVAAVKAGMAKGLTREQLAETVKMEEYKAPELPPDARLGVCAASPARHRKADGPVQLSEVRRSGSRSARAGKTSYFVPDAMASVAGARSLPRFPSTC